MPYKPTGRPSGRPRKHAKPAAAKPTLTRARSAFRALAERLTPSSAVQRFGKRPRRKPSSQTRFA